MSRRIRYWKVNCMEREYPGLWHTWFRQQVAAVGWPPGWRYFLSGGGRRETGWNIGRSQLREVAIGDKVVVALRDHCVGRIGEVVGLSIEDNEWEPTVPPGPDLPHGEAGRRLRVRWDFSTGPLEPDAIVRLPPRARLNGAALRLTICELDGATFRRVEDAMKDDANWESVLPQFDYERSLSDYIATSPRRLEDGLVPYPSTKAREMVFKDQSRLDVLLLDHEGHPVVVECKQGPPRIEHIKQLRGYMRNAAKLPRLHGSNRVRGILVHGGARKLPDVIRRESLKKPKVELVAYDVHVDFAQST